MDNTSAEIEREDTPLYPNQVCLAVQDFDGEEEEDLPFNCGETITIVEPCQLMFWYKAKNESGKTGIIPSPFLVPKDQATAPVTPPSSVSETTPALTSIPSTGDNPMSLGEGYVPMNPIAPVAEQDYLLMNPAVVQKNSTDSEDVKAFIAQEKEKKRRLKAGTLVMGICQFQGQEPEDLPFNVYEEMMIINPMPDLCWYNARKTEHPEQKGIIPVTHITLVYISDDEEDFPDVISANSPAHDLLYDDVNDFISQSGWFSFPGLAHGKVALQHVLSKKCKMTHEAYLAIKKAVYKMTFRHDEKVFVGKATVLYEELDKHFNCFNKKRSEMREIDDELCHHTDVSGWEIIAWPLPDDADLEFEVAKKIIESNALNSKDGNGINEEMRFQTRLSFDKFWDWFMPSN